LEYGAKPVSCIYAINHLPSLIFGLTELANNIPQQMLPQEQPVIEYIFEKDGKEIRSQKYYPRRDTNTSLQSTNEDKRRPKSRIYSVSTPEGEDKQAYTFEGNKLIIVLF